MKGRIWLCVEVDGTDIRTHGETGKGGFAKPFLPQLCQYGGWLNHGPHCGWFQIEGEQ